MLVEGQVVGGTIQGIGGALLEQLPYNEDGQPLAASLMDYMVTDCVRRSRNRAWFIWKRLRRSIRSA